MLRGDARARLRSRRRWLRLGAGLCQRARRCKITVARSRGERKQHRWSMNTANLQLEGVYAVLAALLVAVRDKGVLSNDELDQLLAAVETTLACDVRRPTEVRDSNVDAICFPARFLRQAVKAAAEGRAFSFARLVSEVGQAKTDR